MNDESKLPKWAREELEQLRRKLVEAERLVETLAGPVIAGAGVSWSLLCHERGEKWHALPSRCSIRIKHGNGQVIEFILKHTGEVQAYLPGSGYLLVQQESSNMLQLVPVTHRKMMSLIREDDSHVEV